MVSLLGSGDELLHVIEREFDADIHVRGNEITATGNPAETALVTALFDELVELLRKGTDLTADAVERTAAMLRAERGVRPADVLTVGILSARGRTIRPKTLNQKRYADAIDQHTIVFAIGPAGTGKTYLAMAKAVKALQAKAGQPDHPDPAGGGGGGAARASCPAPCTRRSTRTCARSTTRCTTCSTRTRSRG